MSLGNILLVFQYQLILKGLEERQMYLQQNKIEAFILLIILVSATGYVALAGIYNYLPLLPILNFLHLQQAPQQVLALFLED